MLSGSLEDRVQWLEVQLEDKHVRIQSLIASLRSLKDELERTGDDDGQDGQSEVGQAGQDGPKRGLAQIAECIGSEAVQAVDLFVEAIAREEAGDVMDAMKLYGTAYRLWPALDSGFDDGGLPRGVVEEARAMGLHIEVDVQPTLVTDPCTRFALDDTEQWLSHLDDHGFVVIAGVASAEDCKVGKDLLWDFLEAVPDTKVTRSDMDSWGGNDWFPQRGNGLTGGSGFGHSQYAWHMRALPGVRHAFGAIWGDDDVITSFDGGNVFRPWRHRPEWKTEGGWWHLDQNHFKRGKDKRVSVQGFVTLTDSTAATGGLCVISGSHLEHRQVCERAFAQDHDRDFVPVQLADPILHTGRARLVCARAGDLVLWDSRCVHCNTPSVESDDGAISAEQSGEEENAELLRVVAYVSMCPAAWATPEVLARRKEAFVNRVDTNHWSYESPPLTTPSTPLCREPQNWSDASDVQRELVVGRMSALRSPRQE